MLYVVETTAQRISRLRISDDGAVLGREIFGPSNLGPGFPDGIAFDVAGNLWCAVAMADRIIALTPQGDVLTLLSDGNEVAALSMDQHRSEEHTSELQSLMRISYAVFCLKKNKSTHDHTSNQ